MIHSQPQIFISVAARPGHFGSTLYRHLFEHYKINALYFPRKAPGPSELASALRVLGIRGCSVSMPLKTSIARHLDQLDAIAQKTGSINTILNDGARLKGFNTDYHGIEAVLKNHTWNSVLIYGAGSVVRSLALALKTLKIPRIFITARRPSQARQLAKKWGWNDSVSVASIVQKKTTFDLLINATPASLEKNHEIYSLLPFTCTLFDMLVSPGDTPLITAARRQKRRIIPGIEMCIHQIQKQFSIYTGITPPLSEIQKIVRRFYQKRNSNELSK